MVVTGDDIQEAKTPNSIWEDDLLGRRDEADLLVGYIESLFERPGPNLKDHGYTIAVDAGYGEGKTFFLKRLAEHLSLNHPVAYIDAWADDLADEPLVALLATLKKALGPIDENPSFKDKWGKVLETTGHVSRVVMVGLAKRVLGSLITHQAADFLVSGLGGLDQAVKDQVREQIGAAGQELADEATKRLELSSEMDDQIAAFESSREAMIGVKNSLKALVESLGGPDSKSAPIVIVIDELDRCRPTYAIKLLEEIKHLFDVPGIVFILGLYGDQLSHSIAGAYGSEFDGNAYLQRFINRKYLLGRASKEDLIRHLIDQHKLKKDNFSCPFYYSTESDRTILSCDLVFNMNYYINLFRIESRDLIILFDYLATSVNLIGNDKIIVPYFLPLLAQFINQKDFNVEFVNKNGPNVFFHVDDTDRSQILNTRQIFEQIKNLSNQENEIKNGYLNNKFNYVYFSLFDSISFENEISKPKNYDKLITAVNRFRVPL